MAKHYTTKQRKVSACGSLKGTKTTCVTKVTCYKCLEMIGE